MLYSIGFFIFSFIYLPVLIFKGKLHGDFAERFAHFDKMKERSLLSGKNRIWIQAVSVGEVALCKSLIPLLKKRFPSNDIVISTITKTGNDLAKKIFSKDAIIIYFPLDFSFIVRKAISIIKPALYIMIETEIWPNLLKELSRRSIPCVLINGRISNRSIGKYRLVKPFLKKILAKIDVFCMQDSIDGDRIIELGAQPQIVKITGNMKFDIEVQADIRKEPYIRTSFGLKEGEDLFVAGSTHEGEEDMLLDVFKKLSGDFSKLRLLIAPRHINRISEIEGVAKNNGFEPIKISQIRNTPACLAGSTQILLLDTIGHLSEAYSVATIVFIGGSLVEHGGQNPIEPACFARPILFGRYMFNFKYITDAFLKNKAALQVFNKEDLYEKCRLLLNDANARDILGRRAKDVILKNRGATEKNITEISRIMG
jgi:3-deoxy-D-manno-octulosonic-acid transferase